MSLDLGHPEAKRFLRGSVALDGDWTIIFTHLPPPDTSRTGTLVYLGGGGSASPLTAPGHIAITYVGSQARSVELRPPSGRNAVSGSPRGCYIATGMDDAGNNIASYDLSISRLSFAGSSSVPRKGLRALLSPGPVDDGVIRTIALTCEKGIVSFWGAQAHCRALMWQRANIRAEKLFLSIAETALYVGCLPRDGSEFHGGGKIERLCILRRALTREGIEDHARGLDPVRSEVRSVKALGDAGGTEAFWPLRKVYQSHGSAASDVFGGRGMIREGDWSGDDSNGAPLIGEPERDVVLFQEEGFGHVAAQSAQDDARRILRGRCVGSPADIEVRPLDWHTGEPVSGLDWERVGTNVTQGDWSGSYRPVPNHPYQEYDWEFRVGRDGQVGASQRLYCRWSVGISIQTLGQSLNGNQQLAPNKTLTGTSAEGRTVFRWAVVGEQVGLSNRRIGWQTIEMPGYGDAEFLSRLSALAPGCRIGLANLGVGGTGWHVWFDPEHPAPHWTTVLDEFERTLPRVVMVQGGQNSLSMSAEEHRALFDAAYMKLEAVAAPLGHQWWWAMSPLPSTWSSSYVPRSMQLHRAVEINWVRERAAQGWRVVHYGDYPDLTTHGDRGNPAVARGQDFAHPPPTLEGRGRLAGRLALATAFLHGYRTPRGLGPRIREVVWYGGTRVIDVHVDHVDGSRLLLPDPSRNITGFSAHSSDRPVWQIDGPTWLPIVRARITSASSIRLVLDRVPFSPPHLWYQYGRPGFSGIHSNALSDNGVDNAVYDDVPVPGDEVGLPLQWLPNAMTAARSEAEPSWSEDAMRPVRLTNGLLLGAGGIA